MGECVEGEKKKDFGCGEGEEEGWGRKDCGGREREREREREKHEGCFWNSASVLKLFRVCFLCVCLCVVGGGE